MSVLVLLWAAAPGLQADAQRGGPANVFVHTVEARDFAREIEALGTLEPREQVALSLNAADRVTAIYFEDGERVREGKTLLSLAQREQAALVEAAEAGADEARRQLERVERLAEADAVSRSELDRARRDLDGAEANLRALQSRQRDRVLVAPFDGVLGFRRVSVGAFVRPGDEVATLIDDSEMLLDFDVPSLLSRSVQIGTVVLAETGDLPGMTFGGEVATLDNRIDPVTRSLRARASLANPDGILRSGMFMRVTVKAEPRTGLAIPESAVQPVGPRTYVWRVVEEDGAALARRVEVEIGRRDAGFVEVLSGLNPGEQVITEGIIRVREGQPVRVRDPSMLLPESGEAAPMVARGGGSGRASGATSN
ncbi:MAG: efflux RND transporter periplasmic adaptor subunit [Pseudomonadota bacterium]